MSSEVRVSNEALTNNQSASGERKLWQAVLDLMLRDATSESSGVEAARLRVSADQQIRDGRKDFRQVCWWAGFDPDHVRDAYLAGRICGRMLRTAGAERHSGRVRP